MRISFYNKAKAPAWVAAISMFRFLTAALMLFFICFLTLVSAPPLAEAQEKIEVTIIPAEHVSWVDTLQNGMWGTREWLVHLIGNIADWIYSLSVPIRSQFAAVSTLPGSEDTTQRFEDSSSSGQSGLQTQNVQDDATTTPQFSYLSSEPLNQNVDHPATTIPSQPFVQLPFITRQELGGVFNQLASVVSLLPQTIVTREIFDRQTIRTQESAVEALDNYLPLGGGTLAGLGTWANGFLAQASSTVVGDFTTTGTITFADLADGFLYANGSGTVSATTTLGMTALDPAVIFASEIDTSSELAAVLTDESGSGSLVFATAPTLTGTSTAEHLLTTGNTTIGNNGTDVLTLRGGYVTLGANTEITRAIETPPVGNQNPLYYNVTFTGESGGTSDVRALVQRINSYGANNIADQRARYTGVDINTTAGTTASAYVDHNYIWLHDAGALTTANVNFGHVRTDSGAISDARIFSAGATTINGSGSVGTVTGFDARGLGHASAVNNVYAFRALDTSATTFVAGFASGISVGTGKWGFYETGGANNAFLGKVRIGSNVVPTATLDVTGTGSISSSSPGTVANVLVLRNQNSASANTGVALHFDPNGSGNGTTRSASIQSRQTTAGNVADLGFFIANGSTPVERLTITATGLVGIASTSPWRALSVTGTVGFDGLTGATGAGSLCLDSNRQVVFNSGSDACLSSLHATKHDIGSLTLSGLDLVAGLSAVSFIYNNDASSTVRYGFIAEDAAAVDPHLATRDASGALSGVDDRAVVSILVKAVQELIGELRSLAATVTGFAESFRTKELTFDRAAGNELSIKKLCIGLACITEQQLAALLASHGQWAPTGQGSGTTLATSSSSAAAVTTGPAEPPVIATSTSADTATANTGTEPPPINPSEPTPTGEGETDRTVDESEPVDSALSEQDTDTTTP